MTLKIIIPVFLPAVFTLSCQGQQPDQLKNISDKLSKGETTVSRLLSDDSLMSLHSLTEFRNIIKQNARAEKIRISTGSERGTEITVKAVVLDKAGNPVAGKLVYVYQTSSEGWYSDTAPHILKNEGDRRHARLFGYLKTGSDGKFEFTTVKPKGYPNSSLPAHIHIEIALAGNRSFISELLFDDDPRLVGDIRARAVAERFFIVKNSGTEKDPVYSYNVQVTD